MPVRVFPSFLKDGDETEMTKPHEKLDVWVYAMQLVKEIYNLTANFPIEERFGLTSQMRRAAVSAPSNTLRVRVKTESENIFIISVKRVDHLLNWKRK